MYPSGLCMCRQELLSVFWHRILRLTRLDFTQTLLFPEEIKPKLLFFKEMWFYCLALNKVVQNWSLAAGFCCVLRLSVPPETLQPVQRGVRRRGGGGAPSLRVHAGADLLHDSLDWRHHGADVFLHPLLSRGIGVKSQHLLSDCCCFLLQRRHIPDKHAFRAEDGVEETLKGSERSSSILYFFTDSFSLKQVSDQSDIVRKLQVFCFSSNVCFGAFVLSGWRLFVLVWTKRCRRHCGSRWKPGLNWSWRWSEQQSDPFIKRLRSFSGLKEEEWWGGGCLRGRLAVNLHAHQRVRHLPPALERAEPSSHKPAQTFCCVLSDMFTLWTKASQNAPAGMSLWLTLKSHSDEKPVFVLNVTFFW